MKDHLLNVFGKFKKWGVNTVCSGWSGNDDVAIMEAGNKCGIKSILHIKEIDNLVCASYHSPMRFQPNNEGQKPTP